MNGRAAAARIGLLLAVSVMLLCGCGLWMDAGDRLARAQKSRAEGDARAALIQLKDLLQRHPDMAEARLELGEVAFETGDLPSAVRELELARDGGIPARRVAPSLARAYLASQRPEDALATLEAVKDAKDDALLVLRGNVLLELGRASDAHAAFSRAAAADPKSVDAVLGLARATEKLEGVAAALTLTDRAVALAPQDARVHLARGSLHLHAREFDAAEEEFRLAAEHSPSDRNALLAALAGQVEAQLSSANAERALQTSARMQELAPDRSMTRYFRARALFMAGRADEARLLLEQNLSANPADLRSRTLLGALMLVRGDLGQAEMYLATVVATQPDNAAARQLLAEARLRQQKPQEALDALVPMLDSPQASAKLLALAGRASLAAGETAEGLQYLQRGVASQSDNLAARLDLAAGYITTGQMDRAKAVLESMPDDDTSSPRRAYLTVIAYLADGNQQRALDYARAQADANPDATPPQALAGALLARLGRLEQARGYFERVLKLNPGAPSAYVNLGRLSAMQGDVAKAREYFAQALRREPEHPGASLALAFLDLSQNHSQQALATLSKATKKHPEFLQGRLLQTQILVSQGDFDQALNMARDLVRDAPDNASTQVVYARVLAASGNPEESVRSLTAAARRMPKIVPLRYELARALAAVGQADAAKVEATAALGLDQHHLPSMELLGRLALSRGDFTEAGRFVTALASAAPDHASAHVLAGDLDLAQKDYAKAAAAYHKAAALGGGAVAARREFMARRQGGLKDPLAPLRHAVAQNPGDVGALMALAEAQQQLGMREPAANTYEKVLQRAPDHAGALNNLAWLRHEQGDAKALDLARRAYQLAPKRVEIADTYAWILVERGQLKQGLELLAGIAGSEAPPQIRLHYAIALVRSGRQAEARPIAESLSSAPSAEVSAKARELLDNLGKG